MSGWNLHRQVSLGTLACNDVSSNVTLLRHAVWKGTHFIMLMDMAPPPHACDTARDEAKIAFLSRWGSRVKVGSRREDILLRASGGGGF